MMILGTWKTIAFTISVKPNCLTVSFSAGGNADVFSWDGEGRLWTGQENGISYRRGLNGRVVAKWQVPESAPAGDWITRLLARRQPGVHGHFREDPEARGRKWLTTADGLALEERARQRLSALLDAIETGEAAIQDQLPKDAYQYFQAILAFDRERSLADVERYHQVYKPVGILPPDQYFSVVLQATEGCSFNTCTYCTFYRDRPFRVKSAEQFLAHIQQVKDFIGSGMSLRRTIFLGDANALAAPMKRLAELFAITNRELDVDALGGIFAFLDGFSGERKTSSDYAALRDFGLSRVYIGLESGNPELLKFLKKPGEPQDALQAVQALKQAGVAVGVIVLLGAGGHTYARKHVADTIAILNAMPLDADDLIYFSELIEDEGMEYTRDAHKANLRPLTPVERITQGHQIEEKLRFSAAGGTPHISRYDIREFVY
jgi:hypothetical protein